ncbi:uncharacterized protein LOC142487029 isoform X3 [Ascaphus truei]|uniref:uncharacterized protein LOC142487029 isoform X3 n=1 Tax=Ascaphus truei TaxID=8439 RepID=UPI003F5AAE07
MHPHTMPLRLMHPRSTLPPLRHTPLAHRHQPGIRQRQPHCPWPQGAPQCPRPLPRWMHRRQWRWEASPIRGAATGAVQRPKDPGPVTQVPMPQDQSYLSLSQLSFLGTAQEDLSVLKEVTRSLSKSHNYIFEQHETIKSLEEENKKQKTQIRELLANQMFLMTRIEELQIDKVSKDEATDILETNMKDREYQRQVMAEKDKSLHGHLEKMKSAKLNCQKLKSEYKF